MKKLFLLSLFVFIAGLVLKVFHVHYNAIVMLLGVLLMLVSGIAGATGQKRGFPLFFTLSYALCSLALVFMLKFYPGQLYVFYVALAFALASMVMLAGKKQIKSAVSLLPLAAMLLVLHLTPSDRIYYLFNIKYNYEIDTDYQTWDKYSWFLYRNGNHEEALKASLKAMQTAENVGDEENVKIVDEHYRKIQSKKWEHYGHSRHQ